MSRVAPAAVKATPIHSSAHTFTALNEGPTGERMLTVTTTRLQITRSRNGEVAVRFEYSAARSNLK